MLTLLILPLLGWAPLPPINAEIELLEPEINGRRATVRFTTRNYFPNNGDYVVFQMAGDQQFTSGVQYNEITSGPMVYPYLEEGDYYVRALVKGPDDEGKSYWSNVIWFKVVSDIFPRPILQVQELQPVTEDTLHFSWTPLDVNLIQSWQLQMSPDPDFPDNPTITTNWFPASNEYRQETSIEHIHGEGSLFFRVRALRPLDASPWSNLLKVDYNRPMRFIYSVPHIPQDGGWDTWLQLNVPEIYDRDLEIGVSFLRPSILGDPELTRLNIRDVQPGGFKLVRLSDEVRGAPLLVSSTIPLGLSLHYQAVESHVGVLQITEFHETDNVALTGLVERHTGDVKNSIFSALVLANQSEQSAQVTLRFVVVDRKTGQFVFERTELATMRRWSNQIQLLSHFLPELEPPLADPLDYSITIFAASNRQGLDLLGATFNQINGILFPTYFKGVELKEF